MTYPVGGAARGARAHARRAAVPGTGDAAGDRRRRLHAGRGRRAAPLDGRVEAPRRPGAPSRSGCIAGMLRNGYTSEFAEQIFEQIKGFGSYGFPESHAASFALITYVSCWLKCHEPAAFACALINSQPMGFYAPRQIVQDARRHGIEVRPVDVRFSDWDCTLESVRRLIAGAQPAMRLGLREIRGLVAARWMRNASWRRVPRAVRGRGRSVRARRSMRARARPARRRRRACAHSPGHRHRARWARRASTRSARCSMRSARSTEAARCHCRRRPPTRTCAPTTHDSA